MRTESAGTWRGSKADHPELVQKPAFLPLHTLLFPSVTLLQFKVVANVDQPTEKKMRSGPGVRILCYISPFIVFSSVPVYSSPICVGCSISPQLFLPAPWGNFPLSSQQGFWNPEVKLCRKVDALKGRHGRQPGSCPWATGSCHGPFTKKGDMTAAFCNQVWRRQGRWTPSLYTLQPSVRKVVGLSWLKIYQVSNSGARALISGSVFHLPHSKPQHCHN